MSHELMDIIGNALGLAVLVWKSGYDLIWNPRSFRRELAILEPLEAARRKRERADVTNAIAFSGLALAQTLLLLRVIT